jgi:uncharacterized protein (DUF2147 family)
MRRLFSLTRTSGCSRTWCGLVVLSLCGAASFGFAARVFAATPIGLWYAEGGAAQVEISECGDALCGRIVWLRSPFDETGCELRDRHNSNTSLRDRSLLGPEVLQGLKPADAEGKVWSDGSLYDPSSGKTYTCSLWVQGADRLHLRGYVGLPLLGRTTTWIRVGSEHRQCRR